MDYDIPKSESQCREKLKEEFLKHKNVTDIRVIDMLVIKVGEFHGGIILASPNITIHLLSCRDKWS